jgi:uncharacterized protein YecE (DUF72 family)
LQYYVGCSGWSYSAWQGPFYPANLDVYLFISTLAFLVAEQ